MRTSPNTPPPQLPPTVTLTVEQAKALLKIAEERQLCNELVDQLTADLSDIERRAASAETNLAELEALADRIRAENEQLAQQLSDTQDQVKQIEKNEKKRRWRWLLYGLIIGGVAGAVAAQ